MSEIAQTIDLNLAEKLRDRGYRQKFFLAEASAQIAAQLISLRKRRGFNQAEVASLVGTQQPAISRIEKADYHNWSFNTLRGVAGVLDARIRVLIQPSEDILKEYDAEPDVSGAETQTAMVVLNQSLAQIMSAGPVQISAHNLLLNSAYEPYYLGFDNALLTKASPPQWLGNLFVGNAAPNNQIAELQRKLDAANSEIARLQAENARLKSNMLLRPAGQDFDSERDDQPPVFGFGEWQRQGSPI